MPFPCNGILLIKGNLRDFSNVQEYYASFPIPCFNYLFLFMGDGHAFSFKHSLNQILHQKRKGKKVLLYKLLQPNDVHTLVRILPFPAMISLLVLLPPRKIFYPIWITRRARQCEDHVTMPLHSPVSICHQFL